MPQPQGDEPVGVLTGVSPSASAGAGNDTASQSQSQRFASRLLFGIAVAVLLIDQLSKWWIRGALVPGEERAIVPGLVHLSHVVNHGAAWGMLDGQRWLLIGISVIVVTALIAAMQRIAAQGRLVAAGMGLIFGGAVGNLIDRIAFGSVTDMIDMDTPIAFVRDFPVFNVADSALTIGVCILVLYTVFGGRDTERP